MLYDAHNHLQDERLDAVREDLFTALPALGLKRAVVAGSGVEDLEAVAALAKRASWVLPSFGVHPWYLKEQPPVWLEQLQDLLLRHPEAVVGEIGLDRWIQQPNVPMQLQFFKAQLDLAHELDRPLSIHCLRAWGLMQETLAAAKLPRCGFLLHSYGGSAELVAGLVKLGAYFSVSPYFFHPRKAAQLEVFRQSVPLDRLLLETDAPDMWPPEDSDALRLNDANGQTLNDPRNITWIYQRMAGFLLLDQDELKQQIEANFQRLFGR